MKRQKKRRKTIESWNLEGWNVTRSRLSYRKAKKKVSNKHRVENSPSQSYNNFDSCVVAIKFAKGK